MVKPTGDENNKNHQLSVTAFACKTKFSDLTLKEMYGSIKENSHSYLESERVKPALKAAVDNRLR